MNKRMVKKRECHYVKTFNAFLRGIKDANGPIEGAHASAAFLRRANAPQSVMRVFLNRVRRGYLNVYVWPDGLDMYTPASYAFYPKNVRDGDYVRELYIDSNAVDKNTWRNMFRIVRNIARHCKGFTLIFRAETEFELPRLPA